MSSKNQIDFILSEYQALHEKVFNIPLADVLELAITYIGDLHPALSGCGCCCSEEFTPPELRDLYWSFICATMPIDYQFIMNNYSKIHWFSLCQNQPLALFLHQDIIDKFSNMIYWDVLRDRLELLEVLNGKK